MQQTDTLAIEILEAIQAQGGQADRAVRAAFRANPRLNNAERAEIAQNVHGARCFLRRLDFLLMALGCPRDGRHRLAAYLVDVQRAQPAQVALRLGVDEGPLVSIAQREVSMPKDPVESLGVRHSLPEWLAARLFSQRGAAQADALAASMNMPGPICIRANRLMNDRVELCARLKTEGIDATLAALSSEGLFIPRGADIRGSAAWRAGRFEVQDEGSQLIAEAVRAGPGERVVDLCAGAGGKTLALAAAMRDEGELYAVEPNAERVHDLKVRLKRASLRSVQVINAPAEEAALKGGFDRVLVDAPCSSTGTLRRGPDRRWSIDPSLPKLAALQLRLLKRGAQLLRPKGRLIYATCSVLREENEEVANAFSSETKEFRPVPVETLGTAASALELLSSVHGTDCFFISAWERFER